MALANLRRDERIALGIAIALHVGLVALLLVQPRDRGAIPVPERMSVSLSSEVALEATAPDPAAAAQAAVAPVLADDPAPPVTEPAPMAAAEPTPPQPAPVASPLPRPVAKPQPAPAPRPKPQARASAKPTPTQRDAAKPAPAKSAAKPAAAKAAPAKPAAKSGGGSRIGSDFLAGTSSGDRASAGTPVARIGPREAASLSSAISRQLRPHWTAPTGVDVDQLVTILSFNLNKDGSLAGTPRVVRQTGINDSNRPQADRHAEQAIRAVQLAAPFDLPPELYDGWKRVSAFRFDRKL